MTVTRLVRMEVSKIKISPFSDKLNEYLKRCFMDLAVLKRKKQVAIFISDTKQNSYLCIKAQKVHLFRPRLSFLAEAQPRLEKIGEDKRNFLTEVHTTFFVRQRF
jgi:hypothetical protein